MRFSLHRAKSRRGTSLIELTVATLLVGVLLCAVLTATGQALLAQRKSADRVAGQQLAETLLAEVLAKPYADPTGGLSILGLDLLEVLLQEASYDDADDYHGHSETPPNAADGVAIPGYLGWSRSVAVIWVDAATLAPVGTESGVKRVTVTVTAPGGATSIATGLTVNAP
jgi:MSHA pilin protein MshD